MSVPASKSGLSTSLSTEFIYGVKPKLLQLLKQPELTRARTESRNINPSAVKNSLGNSVPGQSTREDPSNWKLWSTAPRCHHPEDLHTLRHPSHVPAYTDAHNKHPAETRPESLTFNKHLLCTYCVPSRDQVAGDAR